MNATRESRYFPRWKLRTDGIIAPDERLPPAQTLALGLQHVVAMFGATVLAPLLMGFDPNVAILFSGIGTLIFFVLVGGRVPSYLGSSFAFIAVVIAATALMCPRFSATSTTATGAMSVAACAFQTGDVNFGDPIHDAAATAEKSIGLPRSMPFVQSA